MNVFVVTMIGSSKFKQGLEIGQSREGVGAYVRDFVAVDPAAVWGVINELY